jgi:hypothetical protein
MCHQSHVEDFNTEVFNLIPMVLFTSSMVWQGRFKRCRKWKGSCLLHAPSSMRIVVVRCTSAVGPRVLAALRLQTFCTELTSHSPPPTPLLPALTPSAGELKVSRTRGDCLHILRARRSKPKMAALLFWRPFQDSCRVAMVEPPVSYLEPHGPPPLPARQGVSIGTAGCACLGFVVRYLFNHRRPSYTISAGPPPSWQKKRPLQTS